MEPNIIITESKKKNSFLLKSSKKEEEDDEIDVYTDEPAPEPAPKTKAKRQLSDKQKEAFAKGRLKAQDSLKQMRELKRNQKILSQQYPKKEENIKEFHAENTHEEIVSKPTRKRKTKVEKEREKQEELIKMKEYELKQIELDKKLHKVKRQPKPKEPKQPPKSAVMPKPELQPVTQPVPQQRQRMKFIVDR